MSVSNLKQDVVIQFAETGLDEETVAQAMKLAAGALTNDQLASLVVILAPGSTVSVKGSADHAKPLRLVRDVWGGGLA